jgi:hypothetical protein
MGKTRKQRGGQIVAPPFETATPAILGRLSKETGRDFIINVCKKKLPNYLALFRAARGCTDKGCPMKTDADMGWAESEQEFTTQCRRAETLARIKSIPANVKLDPVYVKTTADFLIKDEKEEKAAVAAAKAAANATAKAARNAKAAANAKAASAKAARNAAAKAAAAKAARNAAAKVAANVAAKVPLNPSSSLEQKVENVSKKLERASQLLKSMTEPKSVGGYTRRRRN